MAPKTRKKVEPEPEEEEMEEEEEEGAEEEESEGEGEEESTPSSERPRSSKGGAKGGAKGGSKRAPASGAAGGSKRPREPDEPDFETPTTGAQHLGVIVELARSGRSACRSCRNGIEKGELRFGFHVIMKQRAHGHKGTNWFHLGCFHIPEGMKVDHFVGLEDLAEAHQKAKATLSRAQEEASRLEAAGGASSAAPKRSKSGETAARGSAGRHAAAEEALHHVHPGDARFELTHMPPPPPRGAPHLSSSELRAKYERMSVDELHEVLRANEMLLGGSKTELVNRCVEGEMRGAIPWSPMCKRGLLHVRHRAGGGMLYECPGYFDNVARMYISCGFQSTHVERKPWAMPGAAETGEVQKSPGRP